MITQDFSLCCPVCCWDFKDKDYKVVPYPKEETKNSIKKPQSVYFCAKCGVGIATPIMSDEELDKYYSKGKYWDNHSIKVLSPRMFPGHYSFAYSRWECIESFIGKGNKKKALSILDIGAGHGFFGMIAARRLPLSKYAMIEKDIEMRESAARTWKKYFSHVPLVAADSLDMTMENYDLIVLSHVLEHVKNPGKMLKDALMRLLPRGFLFIDVPHKDYLFKKDVFPHILFFDILSLHELLVRNGLSISFISCYGRDMRRSPINYKNEKKIFVKAADILYKLRSIIPAQISKNFFNWYFGSASQNNNGTWIRALAQRT